jgi:sugar transferase (PEP-CTERM system associated)
VDELRGMPYIFRKYVPWRSLTFGFGEGILIFSSVCAGYLLFAGLGVLDELAILTARALLVTIVLQASLYYYDLYDFSDRQNVYDAAIRITQAWGVGVIFLGLIYLVVPAIIISTRIFLASIVVAYVSVSLWRGIYVLAIERHLFATRLLVLGSGEQAARIIEQLDRLRDSGYAVVVQVGEDTEPRRVAPGAVVGLSAEDLPQLVRQHRIQTVVVALDDRRGKMPVRELLECKLAGQNIVNGLTFYEGLTGTILVERVNPSWIIFSDGFRKDRRILAMKRTMDIVLSVVGVVLALPIAAVAAVAIKVESPGPVLYLQERVGRGGRTFRVIKFRSMWQDAEAGGPVWAVPDDARVTSVGAFIRKTRIDELPQLWNVLRNDMSFVGPRPERPVFVERLQEKIPHYSLRHSVKPGLTGWAQIRYPYGASEEDALRKLEYDLYYIKNTNMLMDAMIVLDTIRTVLFQKGGR